MGRIVMSGPQNVSLDGVIQDPDGREGFGRGGWFGEYGGEDLAAWMELARVEALKEQLDGEIVIPASNRLARTLLEHDLVDSKPMNLVHSSTIGDGLVSLTYSFGSVRSRYDEPALTEASR